ncbi:MAG: hypothetical protein KKB13_26620 [Chloroflexi bacterium]|nr:hypothetical protein [Chloroflexota bacterium]
MNEPDKRVTLVVIGPVGVELLLGAGALGLGLILVPCDLATRTLAAGIYGGLGGLLVLAVLRQAIVRRYSRPATRAKDADPAVAAAS